jgi:succinyl-diaminopimelate desuccinylase
MTAGADSADGVLHAAYQDQESVLGLARDLVRISSRAGADPYGPVVEAMSDWLSARGLMPRRLAGPGGETVALVCEVTGQAPGPRYVLDACLDTAPFGDEAAWTHPPLSGRVDQGWLHGRGSSDSKTGASIFAHVTARLAQARLCGSLTLLFDLDEHTGGFGGARAYFEGPGAPDSVDGVMIGYPGLEHLVTGGRGVLRAAISVHGVAGHSGGRTVTPNAIAKATQLVSDLTEADLPVTAGPDFPLPARLTVTEITGGMGYSAVPDLCTLKADVRLTPAFGDRDARALLAALAAEIDAAWPDTAATDVEITTCWPAYRLPDDSALQNTLLTAARQAGVSPSVKIAGPSNIGNYLAGLGIPATAGFGVDYRGLHGTDERVRVASIPIVQAAYHQACLTLLAHG